MRNRWLEHMDWVWYAIYRWWHRRWPPSCSELSILLGMTQSKSYLCFLIGLRVSVGTTDQPRSNKIEVHPLIWELWQYLKGFGTSKLPNAPIIMCFFRPTTKRWLDKGRESHSVFAPWAIPRKPVYCKLLAPWPHNNLTRRWWSLSGTRTENTWNVANWKTILFCHCPTEFTWLSHLAPGISRLCYLKIGDPILWWQEARSYQHIIFTINIARRWVKTTTVWLLLAVLFLIFTVPNFETTPCRMSNSISTVSMYLRPDQSLSRSPVTVVTSAVPTVSVISLPGRLEEESNLEARFEFVHGFKNKGNIIM